MSQRISKRIVDTLKPDEREFTVWDDAVTGFGLRVRPSGAMSYVVVYRAGAGRGARGAQQPVDPALRAPGNGTVFVGSKGWMATSGRGEGVWLLPASRWDEYKLPPQVLPRGVNHQQDWIRACKGGKPASSNFDYSGPLTF